MIKKQEAKEKSVRDVKYFNKNKIEIESIL